MTDKMPENIWVPHWHPTSNGSPYWTGQAFNYKYNASESSQYTLTSIVTAEREELEKCVQVTGSVNKKLVDEMLVMKDKLEAAEKMADFLQTLINQKMNCDEKPKRECSSYERGEDFVIGCVRKSAKQALQNWQHAKEVHE